jgi:hypothetical protein
MENFCNETGLGVKTSKVRAFVKIAINAGECEIFEVVSAAMNLRDNVLHVKHGQR